MSEKFPATDAESELIYSLNVSAFAVLIRGPEPVIRNTHVIETKNMHNAI